MNHLTAERLWTVAKEDLAFTDEELHHVRECLKCFNIWMESIEEDGPRFGWRAFKRQVGNPSTDQK